MEFILVYLALYVQYVNHSGMASRKLPKRAVNF